VDEIALLSSFRIDAAPPAPELVARERARLLGNRRARRRLVLASIAVACVIGGAGALAATGVLNGDLLAGPSAPPENDTALRNLWPPSIFKIGHATQLAEYDGRKLFGARTAKGGYCFSATSPTDPKGEGGHCMSDAGNRQLDAGETVVVSKLSGGSVGGYAPGATEVQLTGAGKDETFPVGDNGWWLGIVELPARKFMEQQKRAEVFATMIGPDGEAVARLPLICMEAFEGAPGIYGPCRHPLLLD
jgi:hypothetical protein